jgi:hypothetical protein
LPGTSHTSPTPIRAAGTFSNGAPDRLGSLWRGEPKPDVDFSFVLFLCPLIGRATMQCMPFSLRGGNGPLAGNGLAGGVPSNPINPPPNNLQVGIHRIPVETARCDALKSFRSRLFAI